MTKSPKAKAFVWNMPKNFVSTNPKFLRYFWCCFPAISERFKTWKFHWQRVPPKFRLIFQTRKMRKMISDQCRGQMLCAWTPPKRQDLGQIFPQGWHAVLFIRSISVLFEENMWRCPCAKREPAAYVVNASCVPVFFWRFKCFGVHFRIYALALL